MTTYYLQTKNKKEFVVGLLDDRKFISEKIVQNCDVISEVEADSWLEAKQKLGYELTELQNTLL